MSNEEEQKHAENVRKSKKIIKFFVAPIFAFLFFLIVIVSTSGSSEPSQEVSKTPANHNAYRYELFSKNISFVSEMFDKGSQKDTVSIYVGSRESFYYSLSLFKDDLVAGNKIEAKGKNLEPSISAVYDGRNYSTSSKHNTFVGVDVLKVDKVNKVLELAVVLQLVGAESVDSKPVYVMTANSNQESRVHKITVSGANFDKMKL